MSMATLTNSKVSVIEANGVTVIQFPTMEAALSALLKHEWVAVGALDRYTVLFQNPSNDVLKLISQLQMAVRLAESLASKRALARLSAEPEPRIAQQADSE